MTKYRIIEESELLYLLEANLKLIALERGGVDDWTWYGDSLNDFFTECALNYHLEDTEDADFSDLAKIELEDYQLIVE